MTPTRIALIRHGETDWNAEARIQGLTDIPLNDTGMRQAEHASGQLAGLPGEPWRTVYASPLRRAATTAQIIAAELGLPKPLTVAGLVERSFGRAEGLQAGPELDAVRTGPGEFSGAETSSATGARGAATLAQLTNYAPGDPLVVVSHGAWIRLTLEHLFARAVPQVTNASLTLLTCHPDGAWSMDRLNSLPLEMPWRASHPRCSRE